MTSPIWVSLQGKDLLSRQLEFGRSSSPCMRSIGMESSKEWWKLIENDSQLTITWQKISDLHALLQMKRQTPYPQHREMAQAFLADIQRMEEEIHEYLLRAPSPEPVAGG
jgi:hypothetical protein